MDAPISKDELLSLKDLPWERVDLPMLGPGKFMIVQGLSGKARDRFELSLTNRKGARRENVRARLIVLSVVDAPGGSRVFSDEDIDRVGAIRVDVLQALWNVAQKLSGFSDEDLEELGQASATKEAG
jgi:hypothetical protein